MEALKVVNVWNPVNCSTEERNMLSFLYDMFSTTSYLKVCRHYCYGHLHHHHFHFYRLSLPLFHWDVYMLYGVNCKMIRIVDMDLCEFYFILSNMIFWNLMSDRSIAIHRAAHFVFIIITKLFFVMIKFSESCCECLMIWNWWASWSWHYCLNDSFQPLQMMTSLLDTTFYNYGHRRVELK